MNIGIVCSHVLFEYIVKYHCVRTILLPYCMPVLRSEIGDSLRDTVTGGLLPYWSSVLCDSSGSDRLSLATQCIAHEVMIKECLRGKSTPLDRCRDYCRAMSLSQHAQLQRQQKLSYTSSIVGEFLLKQALNLRHILYCRVLSIHCSFLLELPRAMPDPNAKHYCYYINMYDIILHTVLYIIVPTLLQYSTECCTVLYYSQCIDVCWFD